MMKPSPQVLHGVMLMGQLHITNGAIQQLLSFKLSTPVANLPSADCLWCNQQIEVLLHHRHQLLAALDVNFQQLRLN